ncbi:MAG: isopeptide-forming domain-containing fimbrial protein [Clostridiales bacterium]|nr:isopeptide-forming domain-containing fimbrial protein [Clostridiales bacterium]
MKHMKKLASLLLALTLVFALTITVAADETTYSITIHNSAEGHTYEAYQIFTGTLSGTTLSDIVWGSGISEDGKTALGDAVEKAETLKTEADAKSFAKEVAPYLTTAAGSASTVTSGKYVISNLSAGYYLVKDKDNTLTDKNDSYTEYIIKVVGNATATPKSSVPTVEKKVKDVNNSTDDGMTDWQDSADHDIGDSIPFQLKATLANNVTSYNTYKVVFHDTLSKGLTYNNDAKVYIGGTKTDGFSVTSTVNTDGTTTLTVSCDNVRGLDAGNSSVITVEYTATLNDNAVIGSAGNPNEVTLEFSNNPNGEGTGMTPKDVVIVFTYKVLVNKVTKNPDYDPEVEGSEEYIPLNGAGFTLYKKNASDEYVAVGSELKGENMTTFTWSGLDDGDYKLVETTTPAGYNTIEPIEFTVTAEHDIQSENPALTSLSGNATTGQLTFTPNVNEGSLSADVVNQSGSTLPETGGMGTTLFYVLGGILAVGAIVLLVTKKRMNSAE